MPNPSTTQPVPPDIAGITPVSFLGAGGFADVFLYKQDMPARHVAVKVIRAGVDPVVVERFQSETDIMAQVATHPCVVSVHGAGVTTDGRRYLVMEYCRPPHMGQRARESQLGLDRVLRDMIHVCGAVETIHRAGYLHRDIKPSNILVNDVGRPALADFGLAVPIEAQRPDDDFGGASPPWASYEQQVGLEALTPAADVYSLGATLFTLLTGRSPHEDTSPGASNTHRDMLYRAQWGIHPAIDRPDVTTELRRVINLALAAKPQDRYPSALAFARDLQGVQRSLDLPVTEVEVMEQASPSEAAVDNEPTVLRPVASIDPYRNVADSAQPDATRFRPRVVIPLPPANEEADAPTVLRPRAIPAQAPSAASGVDSATHPGPSFTAPSPQSVPPSPGLPTPNPTLAGQGSSVPGLGNASGYGGAPAGVAHAGGAVAGGALAPTADGSQPQTVVRSGHRRAVGVGLAAVLVLGLVGGVAVWSTLRDEGGTTATKTASPAADVVADEENLRPVGGVENLTLTPEGGAVTVTWDYDAVDNEDVTFLYSVVDPAGETTVQKTTEHEVSVAPIPGRTCVEVVVRAASGASSEPTTQCVETP